MPRIPDTLLDRIKHEIAIASLVQRAGIELKRVGENLVGRCNRHQDDTPSLMVSEGKNLFHCMGACQRGGSVVDFVMWQSDVGFHQAARELIEEFFSEEARQLFGTARLSRRFRAEDLPCPVDEETEGQELDRQVVAYYHETGKQSPELHAYLEKRGLASAELVECFRLGLANRTLGMRLTSKLKKRCQERGWFRQETGHEHLNGSLTVPILGTSGEVLNCYGRKLRDDLRAGTPDHLYLSRPLRGVLNLEAFTASPEIVLCEAPIDFLSAWCYGFRNATTTWGAEGFTDDHLDAFVSHRIERVLIAFDRDEAGDAGAQKAAKRLSAAGVACYRVLFPRGMDLNDVVRKMQPADKTLALFFRSAEWMCGGNGSKRGTALREPLNGTTPASEPEQPVSAAPEATIEPEGATKEESHETAAEEGSSSTTASPPSPPLNVSSPPPPPIVGLVHTTDDEAHFSFEDRRYRVFGLSKCHSLSALPITMKAKREGVDFAQPCPISGWHMDKLDLCASRQRDLFEKRTAHELGIKDEIVRRDLGLVLGGLERLQEERVRKLLEPKTKTSEMTDTEREEALGFWRCPDLLSRIVEHFTACGLVGEKTNKLLCYVAAVSRLLDRPLAVIIQSSSAAGKTTLMDAMLSLLPEESFEKYTAVSGKGLFYFDEETSLRHKVLAIVEEEGAEKATYPLKILHSEGELRMASTGKDPATGRLATHVYHVEGPVVIILTTTSYELDPELENRCLTLTVDESREQTRLIHELQRKRQSLDGLIAQKRKAKIRTLHKNAQRLLRPLKVLNPYEAHLTFVDDRTRTRRDHEKYLTIIEALALMHQHQRPVVVEDVDGEPTECVKVTLDDIEIANRIAGEVLGRTLDELQPQTRRFLEVLYEKVTEICEREGIDASDVRLSRKQIRDLTGWGHTQVCIHIDRLVSLEYLLVHNGARGRTYVYELLYKGEGKRGEKFVLGLVDVEKLRTLELPATTASYPDPKVEFSGSFRPDSGSIPAAFRSGVKASGPALQAALRMIEATKAENSHSGAGEKVHPSQPVPRRTPLNGTHHLRLLVNLLKHPPITVEALGPRRGPHELSEDESRRYVVRRANGRG